MLSTQGDEIIEIHQLEEMLQILMEEDKLILDQQKLPSQSLLLRIKSVQNLYRILTHTHKLNELEQSDLQLHIER